MSPQVFGPYDTEQEMRDSPLFRAADHVRPVRGHLTGIRREFLDAALREAHVELGALDARTVGWLAGCDLTTVQVVIGLISRAHAAGIEQGRA